MRGMVIREPGGLEKLEWTELPSPVAGPGQVVVKVAACGVCYRDLLDREGKYAFMKRPVVTGHEFGGEVISVGEGVDLRVGDRVVTTHRPSCGSCEACLRGEETHCLQSPVSYGLTTDGGYAEEALLWAASTVRVPDGVATADACFLHCTAGVALRALRHHGRLAAGDTVVMTGASGGVGVHAMQVAKILGARVIAVTSNPDKEAALRKYGADEVIVSSGEFHKQIGATAQVALDLVGAPTFNSSLRSLGFGGRLVVVGNVTASRVEINPGYCIMRELSVHGSSGATRAELAEVLRWVAEGRLKPVVAERVPLAEARRAQEKLYARGVVGRQVLICN
jgi:D-arabinose 1-dehydrogenase-like Zn-dependent alcohol dehydrogenase